MTIPYTVRIAYGQLAANGSFATGHPPTGYVWVISDVQTWIASPVAGNYVQYRAGSNSTTFIEHGRSTTQYNWQWSGRIFIPATENISVVAIGSVAHYYITGYQLTVS